MNRQENLIQILLKAEKPLTTQELAEQLNVSSRTIRSDLEKIESEILVHSMKLEKKPRVGIWIEGTQDEKDALFLDVKGEVDKKLSEQMGEGFTAAKFKGPEDGSYLIIRYGPDEDGNEKAGSISPAGIFVDMTQ